MSPPAQGKLRSGGASAAGAKGTGYLFDHTWEGEARRLAGVQAAFDTNTIRHLEARGIGPGWRCLEVGAGAGSMARWLSERVGPTGSVLATDISLRLLDGLELPNLEIRRHDVVNEDLPAGEFDLVHCRLVLEHLPERNKALANLVRALAPGGWLVVEDMDWSSMGVVSGRNARTVRVLTGVLSRVMKSVGYDRRFGRELPVAFGRHGLVDVGAEGLVNVMVGGSPSIDWARPSQERMRDLLFGDGPAPARVDRFRTTLARCPAVRQWVVVRFDKMAGFFDDPAFAFVNPTLMTAWGRRPGA
jgi:SAM-dependent methyltransferase